MLTKQEFEDWTKDPVSVALLDWFGTLQNKVLTEWGGTSLDRPTEEIGKDTIKARAKLDTLQDVIDVTLEDLNHRNDE